MSIIYKPLKEWLHINKLNDDEATSFGIATFYCCPSISHRDGCGWNIHCRWNKYSIHVVIVKKYFTCTDFIQFMYEIRIIICISYRFLRNRRLLDLYCCGRSIDLKVYQNNNTFVKEILFAKIFYNLNYFIQSKKYLAKREKV